MRKNAGDCRRLHTGESLQSRQQLLNKAARFFRRLRTVALYLSGKTLAGIEAGVVSQHIHKTPYEQSRAGKQQHSQSDFRHEQNAAQTALLTAGGRCAAPTPEARFANRSAMRRWPEPDQTESL